MFFFDFISNFLFSFFYNYVYFSLDVYLLQIMLVFIFVQIVTVNNLFYNILYLFMYMFFWGLYLNLFQMELFTVFLWLCEFVVVFVMLLFLFYFNPFVKLDLIKSKFSRYNFFLPLIFSWLCLFLNNFFEIFESFVPELFNTFVFWDDFYNSLNNYILTDLELSFIMYYYFNGFFMLIFGYILFICSIVCVLLNSYINKNNLNNVKNYFNVFDFYKDFMDFVISRKQDLNKQTNENAFTKKYYKNNKDTSDNLRYAKWFKMNEESAKKRKQNKKNKND